MTFDPQDPRWTIWILEPDSLSAEERETFDKLAAENPQCQRFIAELKSAAGSLGEELRRESVSPVNSDELETAVIAKAVALKQPAPLPAEVPSRRRMRWSGLAAVAAALVLLAMMVWPSVQSARRARAQTIRLNEDVRGAIRIGSTDEVPQKLQWGEELVIREPAVDTDAFMIADNPSLSPLSREEGLVTASRLQNGTIFPGASPKPASTTPAPASEADAFAKPLELTRGGDQLDAFTDAAVYTEGGRDSESKPRSDFGLATGRRFENGEGWEQGRAHDGETYPQLVDNAFIKTEGLAALSTFSIDVDTASYSNVRRFLQQNMLPPAGAVRVEELVNYFRYDYEPPAGEHPFAVHVETAACPWQPKHRLARIALKGKVIEQDKRPASNLVFLLDVSGSMDQPNKLSLVKDAIRMLVEQLTENDRVAIAVYAGSSGMVLDSTTGDHKEVILSAVDALQPGGSTNGEAGIKLAYELAVKGFINKGTNRVILCTDGDFNVGVSSDSELVSIITDKAKTGVFLSVLGFGMGNYKDAKMMGLADKGNGNYAYIDDQREARKVLVEQMSGTLVTIAKDVKIQVEFNPQKVAAFRLIGYEKRMLRAEDFKDDTKDAGEIGAGHTVTALYELVPAGVVNVAQPVDDLIFQKPKESQPAAVPIDREEAEERPLDELSFVVKLRYKKPDGDKSQELQVGMKDDGKAFAAASSDFQFASAVASFGMLLRNSEFKGESNFDAVAEIATSAKGKDEHGYRTEFIDLVHRAKRLKATP